MINNWKQSLPKSNIYFETDNGILYCGDCIDVMQKIPDNSVHLVITSPPYNVGIQYKTTNDRKDYQQYLDFVRQFLSECYRVLIVGGRIAVNLPSSILQKTYSRMAYLSLDYVLIMRQIGFLDREWITWLKMPKGEVPGKSTSWGSWMSPSCPYCRDASEYIIVMDKDQHKRSDKKDKNDITAKEFLQFTANAWYLPPEHDRSHPAPFPIELPERLLKLYSWQDDIILDPFMGSGTTALACEMLGRRWIGIDSSDHYCRMAKNRIGWQKQKLCVLF